MTDDGTTTTATTARGEKRSITLLTTKARSTLEVGRFILKTANLQPQHIATLINVGNAGNGTRLIVEFASINYKTAFEEAFTSREAELSKFLRIKRKTIKSKSILCTRVPASFPQDRLLKHVFGGQKATVTSVVREMTQDENKTPLWATGRVWINLHARDFDKLRRVPTSIPLIPGWKIKIYTTVGAPGRCHRCGKDGHSKQQCAEAQQTSPGDLPLPKKIRRKRTNQDVTSTSPEQRRESDVSEPGSATDDSDNEIQEELHDDSIPVQEQKTDDSASSGDEPPPSGGESAPSGSGYDDVSREETNKHTLKKAPITYTSTHKILTRPNKIWRPQRRSSR